MLHKECRDESIWKKVFRVVCFIIKVILAISLIIFIILLAVGFLTGFSSKDEESTNTKEESMINNSKYEGVYIEEGPRLEDFFNPIKLKKIIKTIRNNL